MSSVLSQYTVMQQAEWAGRRFYVAQEIAKGQVVYLMEEAATLTPPVAYRHPSLPHIQPLTVEGETRWVTAAVPQGAILEDLRRQGALSETDIVSLLLGVIDALSLLATFEPPLVPAHLDPAAIKRDWMGRWTLDYFLLAQAPESRAPVSKPLGIYAFGVLLYWLLTGLNARMTRVQVAKLPPETTSALQFILIRCLGRSYLSMAELRADIERAGREHEFAAIAKLIAQQGEQMVAADLPVVPVGQGASPMGPGTPPELVLASVAASDPGMGSSRANGAPTGPGGASWTDGLDDRRLKLGVPAIPADDRPWTLPQRPPNGYRQFVVPPKRPPFWRTMLRWGGASAALLLVMGAVGGVALKQGWIPEAYQPSFLRLNPLASAYPGMARAAGQIGQPVPDQALQTTGGQAMAAGLQAAKGERTPTTGVAAEPVEPTPVVPTTAAAKPVTVAPAPTTTAKPVTPAPAVTAPATATPAKPTTPAPATPPKSTTATQSVDAAKANQPQPQPPAPGSADYRDAQTGAMPVLVYIDGKVARYAYLWPHPTSPYISLETFGLLFGREVYWLPNDDSSLQLLVGKQTLLVREFARIGDRIWLKLTPELQAALGVRVSAYSEAGIYFSTK